MTQVAEQDDTDIKKRPLLPFALGIAVVVAITLTCVSVSVYYAAGFYKFDLSRPGYESERKDVTSNDSQKTYDTTTPIDPAAIDKFLGEYDVNIGVMRAYGDFSDPTALSDEALLLEQN